MDQLPDWMRQRTTLAIGIVLVVACAGALLLLGQHPPSADMASADMASADALLIDSPDLESSQEVAEPSPTPAPEIVAYISGAVQAPETYSLPADARVKDLVMAAGGLTSDADTSQINLAQRIHDEEHVHIPTIGSAPPAASTAGEGAMLNINTASAAELEALPGIGAVMAKKIIDYRTAHGAFHKIEDLQLVNGLGKNVYDKIAPMITIGS